MDDAEELATTTNYIGVVAIPPYVDALDHIQTQLDRLEVHAVSVLVGLALLTGVILGVVASTVLRKIWGGA